VHDSFTRLITYSFNYYYRRDQYLAEVQSDEEYEDADAERQLRYFAKQYGIASYKK